ncbi:MAG: 30S ribosomal protein S6 [Anaplasmataceae bacterium]|nr:30S ribosomal protein S6 [Anaplasmataceae bacterium]
MEDHELRQEYEIGYLLKTETDREVLNRLLIQHEAKILEEGPLKMTSLSYPIKKLEQAIFGWTRFSALRSKLPTLEHDLRMSSPLIRFLIVIAKPIEEKPRVERSEGDGSMISSPTDGAVSSQNTPLPGSLSNEDIEKKIEEILK